MNKNDKGWAQLNNPPRRPIGLKPKGYLNKQNPLARFFKAMYLCATTNYSWSISWHVAAR